MQGDQISPQTQFLEHYALIQRIVRFVCARHQLSGPEADEFSSHVSVKLIENDYAVLRKFQGRSSLRTYLSVVVERLFLDYRTASWGKWRPSVEARRIGEVGVLLERLLTRDGHSFDEAAEILRTNHRIPLSLAEIEAMAARLSPRTPRRFEGEEVLAKMPVDDAPVDVMLIGKEARGASERVRVALRAAVDRLDPQDRLILAARFIDGWTVPRIARTLQLDPKAQKALYARIETILGTLRSDLEASGLDGESVTHVLQSQYGITDDDANAPGTPGERGGITGTGPSMEKGRSSWL